MEPNETSDTDLSRRSVLGGIGGAGVASLTGLPAASGAALDVPDDFEIDSHTRATFGAIVDAIVPRTPDLAAERGAEHEPGALEIGLEEFLSWTYDNAQELRTEDLSWRSARALSADLAEGDLETVVDDVLADHTEETRTRLESLGLTDVAGVFGGLRGLSVDVDYSHYATGTVEAAYSVETTDDTVTGESDTYPLSRVVAAMFDVVALEYIAQGLPAGDVEPNPEFDAGGAVTRLAPRDRLRCLEWTFGGAPVAVREAELSTFFPEPATVVGVAMNVHTLTAIGYYSEWEAYGSTRTEPPSRRELERPVDEVQSRRQTGYPGPAPGYAGLRGFELTEFRENDY